MRLASSKKAAETALLEQLGHSASRPAEFLVVAGGTAAMLLTVVALDLLGYFP